MKTLSKTLLGAFIIAGSIGMVGCKGKKEEPKIKGEVVINQHCHGSEYFSTKKFLRASAMGESMDQNSAKEKAMLNAKKQLAASVSTTIKATTDAYINSREMNNKEQLEEKFEGLTREVINQDLTNVRIICEKLTQKTSNNNYVSYVAIEMQAKDILKAVNDRITKEETLRIDYDYEKFKETFEKEMDKLEKGY